MIVIVLLGVYFDKLVRGVPKFLIVYDKGGRGLPNKLFCYGKRGKVFTKLALRPIQYSSRNVCGGVCLSCRA